MKSQWNTCARRQLLSCDRLNTALWAIGSPLRSYTAYGGLYSRSGPTTAFCGVRRELPLALYLLGNGHRGYHPGLMRFHSPDKLSPFGKGGLNAYAYCRGDPVNHTDPSGQFYKAAAPNLMAAKIVLEGGNIGLKVAKRIIAGPGRAWSDPMKLGEYASHAAKGGALALLVFSEVLARWAPDANAAQGTAMRDEQLGVADAVRGASVLLSLMDTGLDIAMGVVEVKHAWNKRKERRAHEQMGDVRHGDANVPAETDFMFDFNGSFD